ncbi:MAG: carbohydrate kinase family protein, partial [Myxococcales bacterium]|nr:carbohydrate kinase family protein [Myxococcales bacterium]
VTLVMSRDGERSFVSSARFDAFEAFPPLPATRWIHVPGLAEAHALREPLARSRATGAKVSVSASWVPDALDALASLEDTPWDMLVLNAKEAARAAGDAERALTALRGAAVDIVVTDGPKGAFGIVDGTLIESRGEPLEVSDATGAGDAFAAGLLTARVRGAAPRDSIAFARRVAERKLAHRGGVAFDPDVYANLEVKT